MATDPLSPFAQGVVNDALQATFPQRQNPDPFNESVLKVLNDRANSGSSSFDDSEIPAFSKQFFGVDSPDQILRAVGPARDDPNTMIYEFAGDGQRYNAPVDKTPEEVLEAIWDKKSPGIWGAAKGATLYNMPSELSSALAFSLEGVGLENLGQEWHQYADKLKEEYHKNYGQYTVPDVTAAWDQGKLYDYALQTIGAGAPYMALGIAGGLGGGAMAAARGASARLGTFLGAAGVTAPVTIAQFADRQVQALKEQGVENPRDHIDWVKAATLGTVAAGLQAIPVDSILFAGPVLNTLEKWGVDLGSKMSTRLLGNMADVAGTNALVGLGTAGLSRMNADMPLLDDEAKAEYLNAAVMGTLVGVPFGLYKGYRYQPKPKAPTQTLDSSFLGDVAPPERPASEAASTMKEDIIYGTDETTPQAALPPPVSGIIRDPNADYGITDRVQAAEYLQNLKYTDKNGEVRDGLSDIYNYFNDKVGRPPSDQELVEGARKAAFVRSRESFLKRTPDGVMYKDVDSQPQRHSNDEKILTKAAALTDQFGYMDTVVRNLSDEMINKLYRMNIQRDLEKNGVKYPDEIRKKVFEDFENFVDKKVMEDVQQYGSIYKRPEAVERINNNIKRTNQMLSENPRKRLAEALMKKRRDEAQAKQARAAQGEYDPTPIQQPFYGETRNKPIPQAPVAPVKPEPTIVERVDKYAVDEENIRSGKRKYSSADLDAFNEAGLTNSEIRNIVDNNPHFDFSKIGRILHQGYLWLSGEFRQATKEDLAAAKQGLSVAEKELKERVAWARKVRNQHEDNYKVARGAYDNRKIANTVGSDSAAMTWAETEPYVRSLTVTRAEKQIRRIENALKKAEEYNKYQAEKSGNNLPPIEVEWQNARDSLLSEETYLEIARSGSKANGPDPFGRVGYTLGDVAREVSAGWIFTEKYGWHQANAKNLKELLDNNPHKVQDQAYLDYVKLTRAYERQLRRAEGKPDANYKSVYIETEDRTAFKMTPGQWAKYVADVHSGKDVSPVAYGAVELKRIGQPYFRDEGRINTFNPTDYPVMHTLDWGRADWEREYLRHQSTAPRTVAPKKPPVPTKVSPEAQKKYNKDLLAYKKALVEYEKQVKEINDYNNYDPMAIRGLLEYKPTQVAEVLTNAANMPGNRATPKLKKSEVIDALLKSPLFTRMLKDNHYTTAELRNIANKYWRERNKAPIDPTELPVDMDTSPKPGEFRYDPKNFKGKPKTPKRVELNDVAQQTLDQLRDEVHKLAMERNADFLKKNPDLGPALNEMFKKFSELSANVKVSEKPRIMRATKKFSEQVMNRVKLLSTVENVFNKIHPNLSKLFSQSFDKMLSGKEMDKATFNAMLTSLHTAFNINKPDKLNPEALATWYKNMRQFLPDRTIEALNKNRQFFVEWYGAQEGVNPKDLGNFRTEDLEAMAFVQHLKGNLTVNIAKFKDLKQKKIFSAFEKSFRQLNKEFADVGYKKLEDILEYNDSPELFETNSKEVPPEARRPGVFADRVLHEVNKPDETTAKAKVEEIKEAGYEANMGTPPPNFRDPVTKSGRDSGDPFLSSTENNIGDAAGFFSFLFSIPKMARKYPLVAKAHNLFVRQKDVAANVDMVFTKQWDHVFRELANKDMDKLYRAADILDHMRNTKQDITTDNLGRVVFKDENGVDTVLSKPNSDIVLGVSEFFKIGFRENLNVTRQFLDHFKKEYNVDRNSSLLHLRDTLDYIDKMIKDNPLPEFRNKYLRDRENLKGFYDEIKATENILQKTTAYVPHMRFGDYVVWVKDRKTGNLVHMEVLDNTDNLLGLKTSALPSKKHADQKIDKLGLRKKFDPRGYEFAHGQLTYNEAGKLIQRGMLSMELIQSLNATGLERNIKLAHQLATGIQDPVSFMKAWSEDAGSTKSHIMKYILAQGMGKHAIRAQDAPVITGYNRNWDLVMDNYKNTFKNSISRKAIALDLAQMQKDITLDGKIAPKMKEYVTDYIDYMQNPSTDYGALRNFNFFWTMGYRFSTAALQLATLPTQAAGVLVGYTGNPVSAMSYLSKGIKTLTTPRNKDFFEKHPAYFRQSMTEDAIAKEVRTDALSEWGPMGQKAEKGFNFIKNNAGIFVSLAENFTRKSTFLAFRNMFEESPEATRKAIKDLTEDYDWQYFWDTNKTNMKVEEALALYHMRLAHAEFGKTGRGPMQRGLFGSLAFPFMTYPQQMLELLFEQVVGRKGAAGVLAGLYTMGAYVALSGLNGIPAYDLWKTLYETYEEKVNGRKVDLNMQLEAAGLPEFLRRGALSMATSADMSSRLAQDMIGQNLLIGLLKDEIKIGEITGVPGRTLVEMMNGAAEILSSSSSKSPMEKAMPFLPSVGKDVLRATQINTEPENYWKTKSGKILADPEERSDYRTFTDTAYQALGFTPLDKTRERERLFMQQRANQEFTGWKSRLAERTATAEYLMYLGSTQDDNEKYEEGRQMRADVTKELREYARANDIRLDADFWRGFRSSVKDRLWQKKNPGKIKKPTKQERKYDDILRKEY